MLQIALGGYENIIDSTTEYIDTPDYKEPGFDGFMSPLEIDVNDEADKLYMLLRKRSDNSGTAFEELSLSNISVVAKDASNGESLAVSVSFDGSFTGVFWGSNPSSVSPVVLTIENQLNTSNPILRVRVIDCTVKDISDDSFIVFRVIVQDGNLNFNYVPVRRTAISDRNTFSIQGREAYVDIYSDSDSYILFSPYAWLSETTIEKSDFSYPEDSIYYNRQNTYNNEDFTFSLVNYSNSFMADHLSVMNIPSYGKAGIILVDRDLYNRLVEEGRSAWAEILVTGELSGRVDTFRVNFYEGR